MAVLESRSCTCHRHLDSSLSTLPKKNTIARGTFIGSFGQKATFRQSPKLWPSTVCYKLTNCQQPKHFFSLTKNLPHKLQTFKSLPRKGLTKVNVAVLRAMVVVAVRYSSAAKTRRGSAPSAKRAAGASGRVPQLSQIFLVLKTSREKPVTDPKEAIWLLCGFLEGRLQVITSL